jgi:hypothetical protein
MFFHHGIFHPHHNCTGTLEFGMLLASAFIVQEKLERERQMHSTADNREVDRFGRPFERRKEEFPG